MSVERSLGLWLSQLPLPASVMVAYSGGRDSHVLLIALQQLQAEFNFQLRALHVHHGEPQADRWASHCQQTCLKAKIPFEIFKVNLNLQKGDSFEDRARFVRYEIIAQQLQANEIAVTAHTQDDQAETFLLQLLRGAGPLGLGGIAAWKPFGKGFLARPLLDTPRADIARFAVQHQLKWDEDETNNNLNLRRNYIRQRILPVLQEKVPGANVCIARSATHCAQTQALLNDYLIHDLKPCLKSQEILVISALQALPASKHPYLLRQWLQLNQVPFPGTKKLQTLLQQMLTAKTDAQPVVAWGGTEVRRYKDCLHLVQPTKEATALEWDFLSKLTLPDGTTWQASLQRGKGILANKITSTSHIQACVRVGFRQGGERCRPHGRRTRSLKKWLQDYQVPTWQRDRIPLFFIGEDLIGVGDLFTCEGWHVDSQKDLGWVIEKVSV